uniref:Amidase family protein n=1 Tax=Solanum tuberosum TaxID=4113 RepID=M1BM15_SOLTU
MSVLAILFISLILSNFSNKTEAKTFSFKETTIDDIHKAFKQNKLTSRQLVEFYLNEIQRSNPILKGIIEVNPDALILADKADQERKSNASKSLSRLHGIPVLVKDNIATKDKLNTTAGSLALVGSIVPQDAGVVKKLRNVGAIILGKATMTEWAASRATNLPNGWNGRLGQALVSHW